MEVLEKRVVQLCFKSYSTSSSANQRIHKVAIADGHVGATSISEQGRPQPPKLTPQTSDHAHLALTKSFSDIPGRQITFK